MKSQDWIAAQSAFRESLSHNPARWRIWVQLGHAAKEAGDLATAEIAYLCALTIKTKCADAHNHLAHLYKRQQRWQQSREHFLRVVLQIPGCTEAWSELLSVDKTLAERVAVQPIDSRPDEAVARLTVMVNGLVRDLGFVKDRLTTYLGSREALTYMADETPIYVNTDDIGGPINVINGGRYEEGYFSVLNSYRRPHSVFLDIGANLGIYSLRMAPYLRSGRIYAFEPNARIRDLFSRSVHLNGYREVVTIMPYALSDSDGAATLIVPPKHSGGGYLRLEPTESRGEKIEIRQLDNVMPSPFSCDLVKIDVEGHELRVLRGMSNVLRHSPDCVVLFEKLTPKAGVESALLEFAAGLAWDIYFIEGIRLSKVDIGSFTRSGGYFLAGRPDVIAAGGLVRSFFAIYPQDLLGLRGHFSDGAQHLHATSSPEAILFHGPYWFLPKGAYRFTLDGSLDGDFAIDLCASFGLKIGTLSFKPNKLYHDLVVDRDLCKFELVLRSNGSGAAMRLRSIRVDRLG